MLSLAVAVAMLSQDSMADLSQLKADFNAAKGKVRIVMLISPT